MAVAMPGWETIAGPLWWGRKLLRFRHAQPGAPFRDRYKTRVSLGPLKRPRVHGEEVRAPSPDIKSDCPNRWNPVQRRVSKGASFGYRDQAEVPLGCSRGEK